MHSVQIDTTRQTVIVSFYGHVHLSERQAAIDEAVQVIQGTGFKKVLIDLSLAHVQADGLSAANQLANRLARDMLLAQCRVAYVIRPDQHDPAVEVLALAKGFEPEHFHEQDQALEWLSDN